MSGHVLSGTALFGAVVSLRLNPASSLCRDRFVALQNIAVHATLASGPLWAKQALRVAEGMVFQLNTQARQLIEDVASRDAVLRHLQKDASVSSESLQRAAQVDILPRQLRFISVAI